MIVHGEKMMMRAGFAQCTITPQVGLLMGGYRMRRTGATGTHDNLCAACAFISDGQAEVVLISLDLLCLPHDVIDQMKSKIFAKTEITPDHTLIACSHTHSGPSTLGLSGRSMANDDYLTSLPDIVAELVAVARQRSRDVKISILQVEVTGVAFNRRIKLKDGSNAINIDKINLQDIQSFGITDPCATALFFDAGAATMGVITNFTLHPTVLGENNHLYSRDYPGYLVDDLCDNIPGRPVGLFFNGAFGNINQIKTPGVWKSTFQEAQRIGETIAKQILEKQSCRIDLKNLGLAAKTKWITIARRETRSTKHADLTFTAGSGNEKIEAQRKGMHLSPEKENIFRHEAQRLTGVPHDLVELQIFQLGEVEIVALPGENFVELGLEIKRRSSSPYSVIFGNANGYIGYIPTESSFDEGGYETRLSLTSRLVPQAGELLLAELDKVRRQK